jgi:preprotein translocase subunit SecY
MTERQPPPIATWLLQRAARGNEALVGDLLEEYRRRRSVGWFWQQVLSTLVVNLSKGALLLGAIVALFLIGSQFSVPGARADTLTLLAARSPGSPFGQLSILTGGQLAGVTAFALGIVPYVSAAMIVQLFAYGWRFLHRHSRIRREVPIVALTRSVAILLCMVQAVSLAVFLERTSAINGGLRIVANPGMTFRVTTLITLTAGTIALMFISDQISTRRIGNGMFLVFVAGVVAGLAGMLGPLVRGQVDPMALLTYVTLHMAIVAVVSYGYRRELVPSNAERRVL